jgi:DNA-binding MarR family transcriptional regulator
MRRVSQLYDEALAPSGLRVTQRSILSHISSAGAPTVTELAAALVMDRGALTHNLKPLERDGLVRMEVDANDRRSRRILLSPAGHDKLRETAALWEAAQRGFEAAFGETESAALRTATEQIASNEFAEAFQRAASEPKTR